MSQCRQCELKHHGALVLRRKQMGVSMDNSLFGYCFVPELLLRALMRTRVTVCLVFLYVWSCCGIFGLVDGITVCQLSCLYCPYVHDTGLYLDAGHQRQYGKSTVGVASVSIPVSPDRTNQYLPFLMWVCKLTTRQLALQPQMPS